MWSIPSTGAQRRRKQRQLAADLGFLLLVTGGTHRDQVLEFVGLDIGTEAAERDAMMHVQSAPELFLGDPA